MKHKWLSIALVVIGLLAFRPAGAQPAEGIYALMIAEFAENEGDYVLAAQGLHRALSYWPDDQELLKRTTTAMLRIRRAAEALPLAERWYEVAPNDPDALNAYASLLVYMQQVDKARVLLAERRDDIYASEEICLGMASAFYEAKQYDDAEDLLDHVIKQWPSSVEGHMLLAQVQIVKKNYPEAMAQLREVLQLNPGHVQTVLVYAELLQQQEGVGPAAAFLLDQSQQVPEQYAFPLERAKILLEARRMDEARAAFWELKERLPEETGVRMALAMIDFEQRKYDSAKQQTLDVLALEPQNGSAIYYMGRIFEAQDYKRNAIDWYGKVEEGSGFYPESQLRIARLEWDFGLKYKSRKRIAHLEKAYPMLLGIPLLKAELALEDGQVVNALKVAQDAIARMGEQPELLYQRGAIYEQMGLHASMEADMRMVMQASPDDAHPYNFIGYSLVEREERLDEAEVLLEKAHALAPKDPFILDSLGWLRFKQGRYDNALELLLASWEGKPLDPEIAAHLGAVYWAMGREKEAKSVWVEALQAHPKHEALRPYRHFAQ